jgi:hypothetical protein
MKAARLWVLLGIMLAGTFPILAQTNINEEQGLKPYGAGHGGDLDTVSFPNGGLNLHIPVASFPQRGSIPLDFSIIYSNKTWAVKATQTGVDLNGDPTFSYRWDDRWSTGQAHIASSLDWSKQTKTTSLLPGHEATERNFIAPDGGLHAFGFMIADGSTLAFPMRSLEGAGLLQPDNDTLVMPNGTHYSFSTRTGPGFSTIAPDSATDANGNQILISASGWTDTLGRVVPSTTGVTTSDLSLCPVGTASANQWIIPGLNGGTRTFICVMVR